MKRLNEMSLKLKEQQINLINFMELIVKEDGGLYKRHLLISPILKKTVDIIDSIIDTTLRCNINVQIALIRLLLDNCIFIKGCSIIGIDESLELIYKKKKLKEFKDSESKKNLTDAYLKDLIGKDVVQFADLYKWACEGVHFTVKACNASQKAFQVNNKRILNMKICVGNIEMKEDIIINAGTAIECCKLIIKMIKDLILTNDKGEKVADIEM